MYSHVIIHVGLLLSSKYCKKYEIIIETMQIKHDMLTCRKSQGFRADTVKPFLSLKNPIFVSYSRTNYRFIHNVELECYVMHCQRTLFFVQQKYTCLAFKIHLKL